MTYRAFSTETWQDPWFEKLSVSAKLLFIYLWTNDVCTQSGCYEISVRRMEFETGLKISKLDKELFPKVLWFPDFSIVWVKAFFNRQCANAKFALAAIRSLSSIPKSIVDEFIEHNRDILKGYGIDTVSIPYAVGTETLPVSVSVQISSDQFRSETEISLKNGRKRKTTSQEIETTNANLKGFDEFWKAYPKKFGKLEARKAWIRQNGNRPDTVSIIAKIEELKTSEQWTEHNGKYIPYPATWLNRGGWDDQVECKITAQTASSRAEQIDKQAREREEEIERWRRENEERLRKMQQSKK